MKMVNSNSFNTPAACCGEIYFHEAYLKIAGQNEPNRQNRAHFFGLAAQAMRHIPVDCARSKNSEKCGGLLVVSPAKVGLYWETCRTSHRMRGENSDFHQK